MRIFKPIHIDDSALTSAELSDLIVRPARPSDPTNVIADLIYHTSPYIYPAWFNRDFDDCHRVLSRLFLAPNNIFSWSNVTVLTARTPGTTIGDFIVGLMNCIERPTTRHLYDYTALKEFSPRYRHVIEGYIEPTHYEAKTIPISTIICTNLCISPSRRGHGLGRILLSTFIDQARAEHYHAIELDCPANNRSARTLYEHLGFQAIRQDLGFTAPGEPRVRTIRYRLDL